MRLWVIVVLNLAGCSAAPAYSSQCVATDQAPSGCVAVFLGDPCDGCGCPDAAISAQDELLYEADRSNARAVCPLVSHPPCERCPQVGAFCRFGSTVLSETSTCELR